MADKADYVTGQKKPVHNDSPSIHDLVIADITKQYPLAFGVHDVIERSILDELCVRKAFGLEKYGTILQAHNGRDPLRDAMDEMVDLLVYLRQVIEEANLGKHRFRAIKRIYDRTIQDAITLKFLVEVQKMENDV